MNECSLADIFDIEHYIFLIFASILFKHLFLELDVLIIIRLAGIEVSLGIESNGLLILAVSVMRLFSSGERFVQFRQRCFCFYHQYSIILNKNCSTIIKIILPYA